MKKVAIFTEGQTELIFVRELLLRLIDPSKMRLECMELLAYRLTPVPYLHFCPNPELYFLIINVHGDEAVLSSIRDREKRLVEEGRYEKILGLRDMYSDAYKRLSPSAINDNVSKQLIQSHNSTIQNMTYSNRIKLHFAIMEIEAWFLAMYNIFQKIDSRLTIDNIQEKLGIDLKNIDPQTEFFRPCNQVNDIFVLCERQYSKKRGDCELICTRMELVDFDNARENGRCKNFDAFYQEVISYS